MANIFWNDIGPCAVVWKGTSIGETFGGGRWRYPIETAESKRDKTGTEVYDETIVGGRLEVETDVTGPTLEELAVLIPGATLSAGTTSKSLTLDAVVGKALRALADELILKPIIEGVATSDQKLWMRIPLAYPKPQFDIVFNVTDQRVYKVMWTCYRSLTTGEVATLGLNDT